MNSFQVECFLAVSECMSFTAAAERLFTVQPTVSRHVRELERELGVRLFDRVNKNRIRLTDAGKIYRELFLNFSSACRTAAEEAAKAESEEKRLVRIGLPEEWDAYPYILLAEQCMAERFPNLTLCFEAWEFRRLYEQLENGRLDMIFSVETTMRNTMAYRVHRIAVIPKVIVMSANHPLARSGGRSLAGIREEPLYVLPESETPLSRGIILSETASMSFSGHLVELPNRATILLNLDRGVGCAMFDAMNRYVKSDRFVQFSYIDDVPISAVTLAERNDEALDALADLMEHWLKERFHGENGFPGKSPDVP